MTEAAGSLQEADRKGAAVVAFSTMKMYKKMGRRRPVDCSHPALARPFVKNKNLNKKN